LETRTVYWPIGKPSISPLPFVESFKNIFVKTCESLFCYDQAVSIADLKLYLLRQSIYRWSPEQFNLSRDRDRK